MSENAFDADGREWFIPPCVKEIRVSSDGGRTKRNPDFRERTDKDYQLISYENAGDGDMILTCIGNEECSGGKQNVDRHDLLQDRMPETTIAMRGICTAKNMFYSDHGFVKTHVVID